MPPDLFKYIPLAIFEDLVIELRVNQYALYSSGYKSSTTIDPYHNEGLDVSPLGQQPNGQYQTQQNSRNFKITRCEIYADLLSFAPTIERMVIDQWGSDSGILI